MQPELFQDRGGFVESGHFDKYFVKKTKEKKPHREKLGVFSPRHSYNYTWNRKFNSKTDKIRSFFDFQKMAGENPPPPPACSCRPDAGGCWGEWPSIFSETPFFLRNSSLIKSKNISQTLCNKSIILCIYQNRLYMHHSFCECL